MAELAKDVDGSVVSWGETPFVWLAPAVLEDCGCEGGLGYDAAAAAFCSWTSRARSMRVPTQSLV